MGVRDLLLEGHGRVVEPRLEGSSLGRGSIILELWTISDRCWIVAGGPSELGDDWAPLNGSAITIGVTKVGLLVDASCICCQSLKEAARG